jgi:translation initiation factor 1
VINSKALKGVDVKKHDTANATLVYSSEFGRMCPGCGMPAIKCACRKGSEPAPSDGIVRIRRETKSRGGKTVTVISGVPRDAAGLKELAGRLKRLCGTGGTVKDGAIEIQGDHCDNLLAELTKLGFRVKRAGG